MTPEQRKNCSCPSIFCKEHPTTATDRHVGPCWCDQCRPYEWRDPPPPKPERKAKVPNRPEWLKQRTAGIEHGGDWDCLYEGEHWAIVRVPGYTGWVALGQQAYHKTEFVIMRTDADDRRGAHLDVKEYAGRLWSHPSWKRDDFLPVEFCVREGRMNQAVLDSLKTEVQYLDDRRPPCREPRR